MQLIEEKIDEQYAHLTLVVSEEEEQMINIACEKYHLGINELVTLAAEYAISNEEDIFKFVKENRPDRCPKGIIGNPKFNLDDMVGFYIIPGQNESEIFCKGMVYIVDANGTVEQHEEPSYDIMVLNYNNSGKPCLIKHVRESELYTMQFEN